MSSGDFGRPAGERTGYEKPDLQRPPDADIPEFDSDAADDYDYDSTEERQRQERGNRGPGEEPGFGQGA
jgi:hypothetical protein